MLNRLRSAPAPVIALADVVVTGLWTLTGLRRPSVLPQRQGAFPLAVIGRRMVTHDQNVVELTLAAPDGSPLPRWDPGAHLDLHLPSGRIRQYSLCGNPESQATYRIAVRRIPDGGGGSIEVHEDLVVGSTVQTGGPRNAFPLSVPGHGSPSRRLRFIAGGIGITPILPMLALADQMQLDWSMIYTGRSLDSIPFIDEVRRFGDRVLIRTDDVAGIPSADDLLGECRSGTTVYACGPAPMLTLVRERLAGRADVELHFERFAAAPVIDGEEFTVTVAGRCITVGADETLLSALRNAGIETPYSCQQGFCGTCRTQVLEGVVQHRDTLLTTPERENGMMLPCVSRAPGGENLRLDL